MTLSIGICGVTGRVGRALLEVVGSDSELRLAAACASEQSAALGMDAGVLAGVGTLGAVITGATQAAAESVDCWVDFSTPAASLRLLALSAERGSPVVIGTTGFSASERETLAAAASERPLVWAPNMSVGVNVLFGLLPRFAELLGADADIEIIEAHHRHKVDAPSGTAVRMGEIIAGALGRDLRASAVYGRQGEVGPRERDTIGFATVRGGDVVGDHTVLFAAEGERVELTHRGSSRANFARGALRAARWLRGRAPGLYDMQDVLGLK